MHESIYFAKCFAHTIFPLLQRRMFCHHVASRHVSDESHGTKVGSSGCQVASRQDPDQKPPKWLWLFVVQTNFSSRKKPLGEGMAILKSHHFFSGFLLVGRGWFGNKWSIIISDIAGIESDIGVFLGWWTGTDSINHLSQLCSEQTSSTPAPHAARVIVVSQHASLHEHLDSCFDHENSAKNEILCY